MHRVFPPVASAGLTTLSAMLVAALPGPLRLTREEDAPQAIVCLFFCSFVGSVGWLVGRFMYQMSV
ncbi:hypothetical protein BGZ63DRAFT_390810 [Mariannaea sp. PMI_226]|nr:hypothetical protein BGZ63DRAFT_390810 [Mariannaea sp. PMI_226]